MAYGAITAFIDEPLIPTTLDLARRLIHFDLKRAGIIVPQEADAFIAKLIDQQVARALKELECH